ncbi:unnamed protein product [Victoria cruziana]
MMDPMGAVAYCFPWRRNTDPIKSPLRGGVSEDLELASVVDGHPHHPQQSPPSLPRIPSSRSQGNSAIDRSPSLNNTESSASAPLLSPPVPSSSDTASPSLQDESETQEAQGPINSELPAKVFTIQFAAVITLASACSMRKPSADWLSYLLLALICLLALASCFSFYALRHPAGSNQISITISIVLMMLALAAAVATSMAHIISFQLAGK